MRQALALALVLATAVPPPTARAQSPRVTEIEFPSDGANVHGRFFSSGSDPLATLVLLPGGDFDYTDVLDLGRLLSAGDVNVVTFAARGTRGQRGLLLKRQPQSSVTIIANPDGHFFRTSREKIASDIRAWLARQFAR